MFAERVNEKLRLFLLKTKEEQVAILFSAYLFVYFIFSGIKNLFLVNIVPLLVFLAVVLVFRTYLFTAWFWLLVTFLIALNIACDWLMVANHDYLMAYMGLMMTLVYLQPGNEKEQLLTRQAKYIFALVMLLAGGQKMFTPEYVDGTQLEFMFLTGEFGYMLTSRDIFFAEEIAANKDIYFQFGRTFIEDPGVRFAWYSPFFHSIAQPMSWIIILSELALGILALVLFNKAGFHIAVLMFAAAIFMVRPEGAFLALLLLLSWSQLPSRPGRIHIVYMGSFLLLLALAVARISFS